MLATRMNRVRKKNEIMIRLALGWRKDQLGCYGGVGISDSEFKPIEI